MDDDITNIINNISNRLKNINIESFDEIEKEKLIFLIIEHDFEQLTLMYQDLIINPEKDFEFIIQKHPYLNINIDKNIMKEVYNYLIKFNYKKVFISYMKDYYGIYSYENDIIEQLLECYIEYLL